jgi:hypothetical protein
MRLRTRISEIVPNEDLSGEVKLNMLKYGMNDRGKNKKVLGLTHETEIAAGNIMRHGFHKFKRIIEK